MVAMYRQYFNVGASNSVLKELSDLESAVDRFFFGVHPYIVRGVVASPYNRIRDQLALGEIEEGLEGLLRQIAQIASILFCLSFLFCWESVLCSATKVTIALRICPNLIFEVHMRIREVQNFESRALSQVRTYLFVNIVEIIILAQRCWLAA
jgi:hypothetical protein